MSEWEGPLDEPVEPFSGPSPGGWKVLRTCRHGSKLTVGHVTAADAFLFANEEHQCRGMQVEVWHESLTGTTPV